MTANPLDVLAQQIVATLAMDELARRRAARRWSAGRAPFAALPRSASKPCWTCSSGRYPSDEFAELRPRIVWDRAAGMLTGRPGRAAARGDQRRHHSRPRAVRRLPGRVGAAGAGRRARRGDGVRVAGRRRVRARRHQLADRGHHPRPGAGLARPGPAGPAAVLEGRRTSAGRPSSAAARRRVRPRDRRAARRRRPASRGETAGLDEWAADNLLGYLRRAARGHRPSCRTTGPCVVERFRDELGDWRVVRALAVRRRRCTRRGRWPSRPGCASDTASTSRPCTPTTASCCGCPILPTTLGERRRAAARSPNIVVLDPDDVERRGHRRGRRLGAVRRPVPRVRGPRAAAAAPRPAPADAAVAAAAAVRPAARGRQRIRLVPDRRSKRCGNACRTSSTCRGWSRLMRRLAARSVRVVEVETAQPVAVRPVAAVRLRRRVPLRGRLAAGRAAGRRTHARSDAAGRAARPGRAARAARPGGDRQHRGRAATACPGPARPATSKASPTCCACSAR